MRDVQLACATYPCGSMSITVASSGLRIYDLMDSAAPQGVRTSSLHPPASVFQDPAAPTSQVLVSCTGSSGAFDTEGAPLRTCFCTVGGCRPPRLSRMLGAAQLALTGPISGREGAAGRSAAANVPLEREPSSSRSFTPSRAALAVPTEGPDWPPLYPILSHSPIRRQSWP